MKVRVIAGIREVNISDPLCGTWIEFVSFPMVVTNYEVEDPDDPEEITLHNEEELLAWANVAFEHDGYELWDTHKFPWELSLGRTCVPGVSSAPWPGIRVGY